MFRKFTLSACLCAAVLFTNNSLFAQQCATGAPPEQWDQLFNEAVAEEAKKMAAGKSQVVTRVIPVIFHVISYTETVGTYPNLDSNEIISQINALNADFAGQGENIGNLPAPFASLVSNTGIQFCRAAVDYTGSAMLEKGINRISSAANNWQSLSTPTLDIENYFKTVIIPATIWDPAKYLNVWVSDRPPASTLTSFGTYPPQSGLVGIFGSNIGTPTNDGIWIYARAIGTTGAAQPPTNKGRTLTHQVGHYLGLRHIWGDGNCLSDYVDDTPVQKGPTSGCPTGLTAADECGVSLSPNGRMYMNFMDNTEDACKYMFTPGQNLRMWTALNQSPLRLSLGTHGLCSGAPQTTLAASAQFNVVGKLCTNGNVTLNNTSSGYPPPTYNWNVSPSAAFLPNNTSSHPFLNFTNPGTYVITLVATNSITSSSYSMSVYVQGTCNPQSLCLDTLQSMNSIDTLTWYNAPVSGQVAACTNSSSTGFLAGTNCYQDREFAQYFPPTTFTSINYPQVNSVFVLFDSTTTGGQGTVTARIYGGGPATGPSGAMGSPKPVPLSTIANAPKVTSVNFLGRPGYAEPGRKIIAYKFDFEKPVLIASPSAGFFAAVEIPNNPQSQVNIFTDTKTNNSVDSSAWFRNVFGTWKTFRYNRNAKIHLAIIPQISCSAITGIEDLGSLNPGSVSLMPNPGTGLFQLAMNFITEEEKVSVRVLTATGQTIRQTQLEHVTSNLTIIDMNDEAEGIYFVEISNGKQRVVKKMVLQK